MDQKTIEPMKKLTLGLLLWAVFVGCKGPQGDTGPMGPQGAKGETGAAGAPGQNAAAPRIYDFNLTFGASSTYESYKMSRALTANEIVLIYNVGKGLHKMLPYDGFSYASNGVDFIRVDLSHDYFGDGSLLFINNYSSTGYTKAQTLSFRAAILTGTPGSRINVERYRDYANLKADFNLPD